MAAHPLGIALRRSPGPEVRRAEVSACPGVQTPRAQEAAAAAPGHSWALARCCCRDMEQSPRIPGPPCCPGGSAASRRTCTGPAAPRCRLCPDHTARKTCTKHII